MRAVVKLGGDAFNNETLRRYHSVYVKRHPTRVLSTDNPWVVTACKADDDLFPAGLAPEEED